jgi:hypothetical protein
VGDVVLFLSLMAQLYGPLAWFGGYYRECLTLTCSSGRIPSETVTACQHAAHCNSHLHLQLLEHLTQVVSTLCTPTLQVLFSST